MENQLVVERGGLRVTIDREVVELEAGDGLFFEADVEYEFAICRYYLVVTAATM